MELPAQSHRFQLAWQWWEQTWELHHEGHLGADTFPAGDLCSWHLVVSWMFWTEFTFETCFVSFFKGSSLSDFPFTFHFHALEMEMAENPRDGWAWWAAVYGITQSQTRLKWLSSSSSSSLGLWCFRLCETVFPLNSEGHWFLIWWCLLLSQIFHLVLRKQLDPDKPMFSKQCFTIFWKLILM